MMNRKSLVRGDSRAKGFAVAGIAIASLLVWGDLSTVSRAAGSGCTLYCGTTELDCEVEEHKAIDFEPRNAGGPAHVDCRYGPCTAAYDHGCLPEGIDAVSQAVASRDVKRLVALVASDTVQINEARSAIQLTSRCAAAVVGHFVVERSFIDTLTGTQH